MHALDITDCINETCPWSGDPVQADSLTAYDGQVVGFCNPGCRDKFERARPTFRGSEVETRPLTGCPLHGIRLRGASDRMLQVLTMY